MFVRLHAERVQETLGTRHGRKHLSLDSLGRLLRGVQVFGQESPALAVHGGQQHHLSGLTVHARVLDYGRVQVRGLIVEPVQKFRVTSGVSHHHRLNGGPVQGDPLLAGIRNEDRTRVRAKLLELWLPVGHTSRGAGTQDSHLWVDTAGNRGVAGDLFQVPGHLIQVRHLALGGRYGLGRGNVLETCHGGLIRF